MAGMHLGKQLLRSGTAPALHYGEVQSSESTADFIHKMKIALKELRESRSNLRIQAKAGILDMTNAANAKLLQECMELIAIFARSIKTAQQNSSTKKR
ncbi:MAG: four helix bundle protein [Bacteroidota bacterium]|nr:four helix bundle protein [Bacteroidota bacterium]